MKRLLMLLVAGGLVMPACAQFSPVQVTVQRISKKKSKQGDVEARGGVIMFSPDSLSASLSLRITLRNSTVRPIEGVVVKWGVAKTRMSGTSHGAMVVYGAEQTCSLKPQETQVIETDSIEASAQASQLSDERHGEKIYGHGVQALIGGKVVWEEFLPPAVKKGFENLRPPDSDMAGKEDQQRPGRTDDEKGGKGKKPKRE